MNPKPCVVLSCAVSLDGCIDDTGPDRLVLSGAEDLDRVDAERAASDAVLVGAGTLRRDDPRLAVRSATRRADREARGLPASPLKVVLTNSGRLDPDRAVWSSAGAALVYCPAPVAAGLRGTLGERATVVDTGPRLCLRAAMADLAARGVRRLLVEGGQRVHTAFLAHDLVDEIHLAVAPLFVGAATAPRFVSAGGFPLCRDRIELVEARPVGDTAFLRYRIAPAGDRR